MLSSLFLLTLLTGLFSGFACQKRFRQSAVGFALFFACYAILLMVTVFYNSLESPGFTPGFIMYFCIFVSLMAHLYAIYTFLNITPDHPVLNTVFMMMGVFNISAFLIVVLMPDAYHPLHGIIVFVCALITSGITMLSAAFKNGVHDVTGRVVAVACGCFIFTVFVYGFAAGDIIEFPFKPYLIMSAGLIVHAGLIFSAFLLCQRYPDHDDVIAKAIEIQNIRTYERSKKARESIDQTRLIRVIEHEREIMKELRMREMVRTEEMRKAKLSADAANRAKSSFLAVISHEIRTPMNGVIGTIRMLKQTPLSKKQDELIETISTSTDSMMVLINDILDFEKIEQGKMVPESIPFDIHKITDDVIKLMRSHAEQKGIKLMTHIQEGMPSSLKGDPTRLRQVLLNLVSNAIKFTARGYVKIHITHQDNDMVLNDKPASYVTIRIEDTGIGIAKDALETLFDPFQQADNTISRQYGGTGLGLAICKNIVEAMNSRLDVQSEIQKGSTFSFSLMMQHAVRTETDKPVVNMSDVKPMRILVVEDNALNQKVLSEFLGKDTHTVIIVDNGETAIRKCKTEKFDLILTDINLYTMNGLDVAKTVRTLDNTNKDIPIVAITGDVSDSMIAQIRDANMNGYLNKPIDYDKLQKILLSVSEYGLRFNQFDAQPAVPEDRKPQSGEAFTGHKLFNMKILNSFADTLGKDVIIDLLDGYKAKAVDIIQTFESYDSDTSADIIKEKAHELRGMAANFGIHAVENIATDIEVNAKNNNIQTALDRIRKLKDAHDKSVKQITLWLGEL